MNVPTKKAMLWFVSKLIEIREDTKRTPNHIADIVFDCNDIVKEKSTFNISDKAQAQNKSIEMLALIKNDGVFLDSLNHFDGNRLSYEVLLEGNLLIKGYQIEVLSGYLEKINGNTIEKSKIIFKNSDGDYFLNRGNTPKLLKLKKTSLYYSALDTVYSLRPEGGIISFGDFAGRVLSKIKKKLANKGDNVKCKIIRSYLTDKSNGFLRASKIGETTFNNKPLIECEPGTGIIFNNKK